MNDSTPRRSVPRSAKIAALRALEAAPPAKLGTTPSGLLVLWKLAARMNHVAERSRVRPSHATIAADTGLSRRTVRRTLSRLAAIGLLTISSGQLNGTANTYHLEVAELCQRAGTECVAGGRPGGAPLDLARELRQGTRSGPQAAECSGGVRESALQRLRKRVGGPIHIGSILRGP